MNGSTLTVTILEAHDLVDAFNKDIVVLVSNEESRFKTKIIRYKSTQTMWNETFNAYNILLCLL